MPLTEAGFDAAARRFARALTDLAPLWEADQRPLLVALSGGADSTALLWLAAKTCPGRVHALTVDHGLRAEAADEALACAALCDRLAVPHRIARPAKPIGGNIQSEARKARYFLLGEEANRLGGALIATAHHADDQMETTLMRLARGSGVGGLAGIRERNGNIVRPLLGFTKAELVELCRANHLDWIEDPSNRNPDFDRVRMRAVLEEARLPVDAAALSRSTKALADADEALDFAADLLARERIAGKDGGWTLDPSQLPHELVRRLLLILLQRAGEAPPRGEALERTIAALNRGKKVSLGALIASGGTQWSFASAPPRRA